MALPAITYEDFKGYFKLNIPQIKREDGQFDLFIADRYPRIAEQYLGNEALTEIKAQDPLRQKWQDLFNGVSYYDADRNKTISHQGFRKFAIAGVYFYFIRESGTYNTPTGNVNNKNGNSNFVNASRFAQSRYNGELSQLEQNIYPFIDYYREVSGIVSSSIDNGGGAYTLNVSSTIYLADGDKVRIENTDYVVSNVVDNTSFDIVASSAGLDFTAKNFVYEPFKIVCKKQVNAVW